MNILFLDFLHPKGHKEFNMNLITRLSDIGKVTVLCQRNYYNGFTGNTKDVTFIEEDDLRIDGQGLMSRIAALKIMTKSSKIRKKYDYDKIIVSSFETLSFTIGRFFFKEMSNMYIIHHNNVDELSNSFKLKFFKTYMNKVNHIVLDEFIKEYLINKLGVNEHLVHVLPHPLNEIVDVKPLEKSKYLCVGLSNSNDEEFIRELVKREIKDATIQKMGKKVILKSKSINFDNGYLKIVNGFLEKSMYDDYISNSKFIFMPFPKTFRYRMSGTLMDAISNGRIVIGSNIPLIKNYNNLYPSLCKIVKDTTDFYVIIKSDLEDKVSVKKEFSSFSQIHSKDNILSRLKDILKERKHADQE
ncbi:glycosyltransferase family protein [Neobacillus vireti]|uniref:Glycosyltransferase n=1 Tax=Neobacillus vireti LMG 21834 TaxID=1131730 RepID=A0AB94IQ74_9BACI|nr:hypothetical protein [Neobacillus vireti]ETI69194.1 hypothetical protein BAVI_08846 [Neobacillus vireti LMG 21834]KLT15567.1 hypothetical protein AA980_23285 [Neobacillus vireti]